MKNSYDPKIHNRRSIRLKGFDYSNPACYFITMVTKNRVHFFGEIENKKMIANDAGQMIIEEWMDLKNRFTNIELHEYVLMPNHFHGILEILPLQESDLIDPTYDEREKKKLGEMVGAFESITTVNYIRGVKNHNWQRFDGKLWQRNYFEHIIRTEKSFLNISNYIKTNPENWENDKFSKPPDAP